MAIQQIDRATFGQQWQEWHLQRERELADEHGFLAITGRYWLRDEPQRIPGIPGAWSTGADGPRVTLGEGEELVVDGTSVRGEHRFGVIEERGGRTAVFGDTVIEVAKRGGRDVVRPRDPNHALRLQFREVPTYLPNPRWAFVGRFVPFDPPRPTTVGSVVEGLEHVYEAPGFVEFEHRAETFRLTAFGAGPSGQLSILFTDATSGITTYPASRSLHTAPPDEDGTVNLDFNRAVNLPCAFTDYATCPLPPPENHLPIGIEVGEKIPYERA